MKKVNFEYWTNSLKEKATKLKVEINKDFTHAFQWGYVEELFTLEVQMKLLENLNDLSIDETNTELQKMIISRLPLRTSSNESSNRAEVLTINAISNLIGNIGWYAE